MKFTKCTIVLICMMMWLSLSGFAGLGNEGDGTLNDLLDQLSPDDVEEIMMDDEWSGRVMANVEDSVSVREDKSTDSSVVGKMFKGDCADILEQEDDWTKISSGDVTGWVSNDYLAFGADAEEVAKQTVPKVATVTTTTLKVRDEANTEAPVIDLIGQGEKIEVGEEEDGWLQIIYSDGEIDYISSDFVDVSYNYGTAKTIEEIEEEEARRAAEEEKAKRTKNLGAIAASSDETSLLGALIQAEAANQPYEGKLGVGAVVMNRVRSGAYPNSIQGVISAPGQFGPASTGQVSSILATGVNSSCRQAAEAAIAGETTVGTATHFRRASGGQSGIVIGAHVFY